MIQVVGTREELPGTEEMKDIIEEETGEEFDVLKSRVQPIAITRDYLMNKDFEFEINIVPNSSIKESEVDIVFIDIKMPDINGLEVFLEIKKINPKITGIMITAYRKEVQNLVKEALENELYDCLYKPIENEKIIALIEPLIRKKIQMNENPMI